ncbi:ATP-binding cassette domain-containing protein [Aerococcaceae bacterium zg-ZJ1578]|uniref:ATP-binding cassette domain-containing protein n=1 Tax=Aerococcaceae bacterium zg-252 TaxID=2796928 RepID=UPI001A1A89EA|nr:ATP-binding cassette domain-containing protein [Aerococcaceae bacterium zg-1578]
MKIIKLVHQYKDFKLDISDLTIHQGKTIGLIGENGAGKTTLMNVLSGLLKVNGEFICANINLEDILFIPSELQPYDFLTVKEFCQLVLSYNNSDKDIVTLLEELELIEHSEKRISELSQGMRKKLTLIMLYVKPHQLIILDEPFNGIDVKYVLQLKQLIKSLKEKSTVVISSHIIDTLYDLCDEFIFLKDGTVSKIIGSHQTKEELEREIVDFAN